MEDDAYPSIQPKRGKKWIVYCLGNHWGGARPGVGVERLPFFSFLLVVYLIIFLFFTKYIKLYSENKIYQNNWKKLALLCRVWYVVKTNDLSCFSFSSSSPLLMPDYWNYQKKKKCQIIEYSGLGPSLSLLTSVGWFEFLKNSDSTNLAIHDLVQRNSSVFFANSRFCLTPNFGERIVFFLFLIAPFYRPWSWEIWWIIGYQE